MTPTEHDTRLLELYRDLTSKVSRRDGAASTIMAVTDNRTHAESYKNYKRVPDPRPFAEALATLKAGIADPDSAISNGRRDSYSAKYSWPNYLERFETATQEAAVALQAVVDHEANYTGWDRFWLVTSSPGHVHSSRNCSSCKWTTQYALVPVLSAQTEQEAVATFGPAMCSVCFPTAPTGAKISKALAESVGTKDWDKNLAKHQAKNGVAA